MVCKWSSLALAILWPSPMFLTECGGGNSLEEQLHIVISKILNCYFFCPPAQSGRREN